MLEQIFQISNYEAKIRQESNSRPWSLSHYDNMQANAVIRLRILWIYRYICTYCDSEILLKTNCIL